MDKSLDYLQRSIQDGRSVRMIRWAQRDPDLEAVRSRSRFQVLVKEWANSDLTHSQTEPDTK